MSHVKRQIKCATCYNVIHITCQTCHVSLVGRFSQHHVDQLDLKLTALESFQKQYPHAKPLEIRAHLGSMGLGGNSALQRMSTLSGGQKSRVAFAQIMWQKPHLLLLDEPTNHLDLDAVEAAAMPSDLP